MKRGQGLSLNTIIIAAIVLIVLIVLWAIFTGRMGAFTTGVKKESEGEPTCDATKDMHWSSEGACEEGEVIVITQDRDQYPGQICCKKVT